MDGRGNFHFYVYRCTNDDDHVPKKITSLTSDSHAQLPFNAFLVNCPLQQVHHIYMIKSLLFATSQWFIATTTAGEGRAWLLVKGLQGGQCT